MTPEYQRAFLELEQRVRDFTEVHDINVERHNKDTAFLKKKVSDLEAEVDLLRSIINELAELVVPLLP